MTDTNQREPCRVYVPDPDSDLNEREYTPCLNCLDWEMTHSSDVLEESEKAMRRAFAAFWRLAQ